MNHPSNEMKIIIAGFGGQGIVVVGNLIARAAVMENKNVIGMVSYGAEMRGGTANATVVVSEEEIACPFVVRPDVAIVMNQPSLDRFEGDLVPGGLVLLNTSLSGRPVHREDLEVVGVPATEMAQELGNIRTANIVMLGAFLEYTALLQMDSVSRAIEDLFGAKNPKYVPLNREAMQRGRKAVLERKIPHG